MSRPANRVLALLELLQSRNQLGGAELAQRLDVDRRTLRRYIAALEDMGIPIRAEQGRYGGYRLVPGFKLPPMMFNEDEAQALSLGLLAAKGMGLLDIAPAIESAQAKIDRVLPSGLKASGAAWRESIALYAPRSVVAANTRSLRRLSEAAQARQTVHLDYVAAGGGRTARAFDVYGVVFRGGRWYIVGHCHLRLGLRTLRVDRIAGVETSQAPFTRPKDFDAAAYLTRALETLPRSVQIEVLLRTDLTTARDNVYDMLGTLEAHAGGVLLRSTADDLDWYARQLIGLPFEFAVQTPEALTTVLARLTRQLAARFQDQVSTRAPASATR